MNRQMPTYIICDTDGRPVEPDEAKAIIAEHWTVPTHVRARRHSKKAGKAPQTARTGQHQRGDLPSTRHHRPTPPTRSTTPPTTNRLTAIPL
jgi:hypothetical protein